VDFHRCSYRTDCSFAGVRGRTVLERDLMVIIIIIIIIPPYYTVILNWVEILSINSRVFNARVVQ
jgi:hypothetical protein